MDVTESTPEAERKELEAFVSELSVRIATRLKTRSKNLEAPDNLPDESFFRKLDSNLKKTTAFVKKLKTLTESQKTSLIKDFGGLNLSKYVGEIASSLVEVKLKMSDVPTAVEISSLAHQRYAEFSGLVFEQLKRVLPRKKDEKPANPSKFRVDFRFFAELIALGVIGEKEGLPVLGAILKNMTNADKETHQNLPTITAFCRYCGEDYAGLLPRKYKSAAQRLAIDIPKSEIFSDDRKRNVLHLLLDYYQSLATRVAEESKAVKRLEKRNKRQYMTKGEIYPENKQEYETAKTALDKLYQSAVVLAEMLDQDEPPAPKEDPDDEMELDEESGMIIQMDQKTRQELEGEGGGLWEDEDTRQFYETLPELREMLPGILYKESEEATLKKVEERIEEEEETPTEEADTPDPDKTQEPVDEVVEPSLNEKEIIEELEAEDGEDNVEEEEEPVSIGSQYQLMMQAFVKNLPTLINRDMIDKAAVEFVTNLNTKINRKKLVRALYGVQRTRLDLLPFYSRLVAVLEPVMPDLGTELIQLFTGEFRAHVRKKQQVHTESKIKCCRFIGELTKFKIFPKSEALHCFKMLLFDFRHHNIEMACALIDACGYFLYHSVDSHQKTKILLEQMMRKKQAASSLDSRYHLLIENAYFTANPPPGGTGIQKIERPPMHEYIRYLLFKELSKTSVESVLKQIRKLDWTDKDTSNYAIKCLSAPSAVRFSCVQWLASVLAGLMWYHDWVGHNVVDTILEDIRLGMEVNHPKFNQRRIAAVRYLGEMYNYRVVDSGTIFNTLYSFIVFGVPLMEGEKSLIDPPQHLFRIRLAAVLLQTCGEYFNQGSSKKKLDCFLVYLQRYFWEKKGSDVWTADHPFPVEVDNIMTEILDELRPDRETINGLDGAKEAVKKIEEEYKEKVESALKFQSPEETQIGDEDFLEEPADGLEPIEEEDHGSQTQTPPSQTGPDRSTPIPGVVHSDESIEESSEEDEEVHVHLSKSKEDDEDKDFMAAFDSIMSETLHNRIQEKAQIAQADFSVPANVKAKIGKTPRFADSESGTDEENEVQETTQHSKQTMLKFVLMTKQQKGGKPALKHLKVSLDSDLARTWKDREEAELQEKAEMKQITLAKMKRMEQEELDEAKHTMERAGIRMTDRRRRQPNSNQPHHGGFQHQRGAPMPNEIFKNWT